MYISFQNSFNFNVIATAFNLMTSKEELYTIPLKNLFLDKFKDDLDQVYNQTLNYSEICIMIKKYM